MGVSRVVVNIDRVMLRGFKPADSKAVVEGLRGELEIVLGDRATRAGWARPHRTPVLKLGSLPLEPGAAGARQFGTGLARAIGRGLKP